MPLTVVSFAADCTSIARWCKGDYDAHDFAKALKGHSVNEYAWVKVRGRMRRFDNSTREKVVSWFGQMAADYLREHGPSPPFALVPVPSSFADRTFRSAGATARMARAVANEMGPSVTVRDVLRFNKPMMPSRLGGSRDALTILGRLRLVEPVYSPDVVLVDDAVVTGAHLRAAAAKLRSDDAVFQVALALCGVSAERQPVSEAFRLHYRQLVSLEDAALHRSDSPALGSAQVSA